MEHQSEQPKSTPQNNPIVTFMKVWRTAERVAATIAVLLVLTTAGFVSVHVLT
ncbi:MAG: hypothetical protein K6T78_08640 [Alicyclobacillus sp.]|nr:hypothetical protein [Alicyclobacillus sp.]